MLLSDRRLSLHSRPVLCTETISGRLWAPLLSPQEALEYLQGVVQLNHWDWLRPCSLTSNGRFVWFCDVSGKLNTNRAQFDALALVLP